ncbi:SDR family oxidoreductase [Solidesulfovibrio sp.]|uniref:SDR family oxidoreductase n=1 Tax=Solidesulfovibrio sp. TaxID=2910990 RepID=UPI002636186F|nr:SDR family oxidoreductase [Solidesulfovibrio sp.]
MSALLDRLRHKLAQRPARWCVTGAAGFIGSHLAAALLALGQDVTVLDNLSTGRMANLDAVRALVGEAAYARLRLVRGDITDPGDCREAVSDAAYVLHHAALGSVPLSLEDPLGCNAANVTGCCNMLEAARTQGVAAFVYASSSAVYGEEPGLPKTEDMRGAPLSPYALSKTVNELYADVYARCYGLRVVGLRYFNVFGPRQDPNGAYAAVIPRWFDALARGEAPQINGDGLTTRDFCYVADVVRANLLAATSDDPALSGQVCNIGSGKAVTLLELFAAIRDTAATRHPGAARIEPVFGPPRAGDIRHSLSDISKAARHLGFTPQFSLRQGLEAAADWYLGRRDAGTPAQPWPDVGAPTRFLTPDLDAP